MFQLKAWLCHGTWNLRLGTRTRKEEGHIKMCQTLAMLLGVFPLCLGLTVWLGCAPQHGAESRSHAHEHGPLERAGGLTELHLGFFKHRGAIQQQRLENFPPPYHDLAMAHHQAAEDLAQVLPSGDYDHIMPKLNGVLRACVACHLQYRVDQGRGPAE